jgi:hypothetical protein
MDQMVQYYRCDGCRNIVSRRYIMSHGSCKCGFRGLKGTRTTKFDRFIVWLFRR